MPFKIQEEKSKSKFKVEPINYKFDKPLGDHLLKHPWIKPTNSIYSCIGRPKSGKSVLIDNIFKSKGDKRIFKYVFDKIFLFVPASSYHPENSVFGKLKPE